MGARTESCFASSVRESPNPSVLAALLLTNPTPDEPPAGLAGARPPASKFICSPANWALRNAGPAGGLGCTLEVLAFLLGTAELPKREKMLRCLLAAALLSPAAAAKRTTWRDLEASNYAFTFDQYLAEYGKVP